jgi:opacity protein-like surface antigen
MKMKTNWKLAFCFLLCPTLALAQLPAASGSGPGVSGSIGYSYLNLPMNSPNRINLNGVDASITVDFHPHLGAKVDINYVRAANVFGTGHHSDVLSYLVGPVFYPTGNGRLTTYAQALVGGARVTGPIPNGTNGFLRGYVNRPSWAFGGGIEYRISSSFAFRTGADYLHTYYFDSPTTIRGQNDFRIIGSVVYRWSGNAHR